MGRGPCSAHMTIRRVDAAGAAALLQRHAGPHREETFRELQGTLRTVIGGEARVLGPGEAFAVPAGTPHTRHADAAEPPRFVTKPDARSRPPVSRRGHGPG
jgi:quercetin dioxygenase-like cupin family protein